MKATLSEYEKELFSCTVDIGILAHFLGNGEVAFERVHSILEDGTKQVSFLGKVEVNQDMTLKGPSFEGPDQASLVEWLETLAKGDAGWFCPKPEGRHPFKLRTPARAITQRKGPCWYCPCESCTGEEDSALGLCTMQLEDGSRICDICWYYPPCGASGDCEQFELFGHCSHRPKANPFQSHVEAEAPKQLEGKLPWITYKDFFSFHGHCEKCFCDSTDSALSLSSHPTQCLTCYVTGKTGFYADGLHDRTNKPV